MRNFREFLFFAVVMLSSFSEVFCQSAFESVTIGTGNTSTVGKRALSQGESSRATGLRSVALGYKAVSSGTNSFTVGSGTSTLNLTNSKSDSFLFGYNGIPVLFGTIGNNNTGTIIPPPTGLTGSLVDGYATEEPTVMVSPRIGIGTVNPKTELDLVGRLKIHKFDNENISSSTLLDVKGVAELHALTIVSLGGSGTKYLTVNNKGEVLSVDNPADNLGNHTAVSNLKLNGKWLTHNGVNDGLFITSTNKVGIGTTNTLDYKLAVNGNIGAKGVVIENNVVWPDYVFEDCYELRSLIDVERYIKEHGHLPEVPSSAEVSERGVDVGSTHALLLKKVEELTLYMIDQDKRLNAQQNLIEQQQQLIDKLLNE